MRCADALRACVQTRMSINKKHKHKKELTEADGGCEDALGARACRHERVLKKSKKKKRTY